MISVYKPKNGFEAYELFVQPVKLSAQELNILRVHLKKNPEDLAARLKLIGNIQFPKTAKVWQELVFHLTWFIENHPEHPTHLCMMFPWNENNSYYALVSKCWKKTLRLYPNNGLVQGNAGKFFSLKEPVLALKIFRRSVQLEPKNVRVLENFYSTAALMIVQKSITSEETLKVGVQLFSCLKKKNHRASLASNLMLVAALAKNEALCKKFSRFVLSNYPLKSYFGPKSIHCANVYLAWCSFRSGNMKNFDKYLTIAEKQPFKNGHVPFAVLYRDIKNKAGRDRFLRYLQTCFDNNCGWQIENINRELLTGKRVVIEQYLQQELCDRDFYNWSPHY